MENTGFILDAYEKPALVDKKTPPLPPALPCPASTSHHRRTLPVEYGKRGRFCMYDKAKNSLERLFDEGYRADVTVITENGGSIYAHANILGIASPVMKGMLKQAKGRGRQRSISIRGVPHDAVRVFIRFLYSSCFEKEEMEEFVLHLLVLSHVFVVPDLKNICIHNLIQGFLTTENVIDILQLALLCDAPRLSLVCHRMILTNFRDISMTEGWKAMRQSHPVLEEELVNSMVDETNRQKERNRKSKERKIYLQLYEAMEALVHICRDGCRTIGPYDKDLRNNESPCNYAACKGLEQLVRHFSTCKLRIPGGCVHCKRMWQLFELHSRLCADSDECRVPLCKNFKVRIRKQSKKDEIKWKILVKKISKTKRIGGSPFFSSPISSYSSSN